jgi:hypothetical protein
VRYCCDAAGSGDDRGEKDRWDVPLNSNGCAPGIMMMARGRCGRRKVPVPQITVESGSVAARRAGSTFPFALGRDLTGDILFVDLGFHIMGL